MTKRQTRLFFVGGHDAVLAHLHRAHDRQPPPFRRLTHEEALDAQVVAGKHVWHRKNCINCHTLLGEGAYYAPDLTKITSSGASPTCAQFLKDPSRFYSEERTAG